MLDGCAIRKEIPAQSPSYLLDNVPSEEETFP